MNKRILFLLLSAFVSLGCLAGGIPGRMLEKLSSGPLFPTFAEKIQQAHIKILATRTTLEQESASIIDFVQKYSSAATKLIDDISKKLLYEPDNEFYSKALLLLQEQLKTLLDIEKTYDHIVETINTHFQEVEKYINDTELKQYKSSLKMHELDTYSLDHFLLFINENLLRQEKLRRLELEQKTTNLALTDLKAYFADIAKAHEKRRQGSLYTTPFDVMTSPDAPPINIEQREQLAELAEDLYQIQKKFYDIKREDLENTLSLILTQLAVTYAKVDIIERVIDYAKPLVKIDKEHVDKAQLDLVEKKREWLNKNSAYTNNINQLNGKRKDMAKTLIKESQEADVGLNPDLDSWIQKPQETALSYGNFYHVAAANDAFLTLKRTIELLEAEQEYAREAFELDKTKSMVKQSYHKITTGKFSSEEEITQDVKRYERARTATKARLIAAKEKKDAASHAFIAQNKILESITEHKNEINARRNTLFKDNIPLYHECLDLLKESEKSVLSRRVIISEVLSKYTELVTSLEKRIHHINFIIGEIESKTFWYRPEHAISWNGLKKIIPDVQKCIGNIAHHFGQLKELIAQRWASTAPRDVRPVVVFIIELILCLLFFILLRWFFSHINTLIQQIVTRDSYGASVGKTVAVLFQFFVSHLGMLTFIISLTALVIVHQISNPALLILVYLILTPLLLYLAHQFIRTIAALNAAFDYTLISKGSQQRFITMFSILFYASIIIYFLRRIFFMNGYQYSELPSILLAINFIILQVALISLITKEQVLSIIPLKSDFWKLVYKRVNTYYYFLFAFLIAIIVMSNPYVGFGKLIFYALSHLIYTAIFIRILYSAHYFIKQASNYLFFLPGEEKSEERFEHATTWYGGIVITSFVGLILVGIITLAKIWGWPESLAGLGTWRDFVLLLKTPIVGEGTTSVLSAAVMIKIIGIVILGYLVSIVLNRFIFDKIFEVLLVESGVQNAITSISQYAIMLAFVFFAFQSQGLGHLINAFYIGLAAIGLLIKDPLSDLFAYFIILIQQPVKIGDFIRLDEEHEGVVRTITPRTVMLRRKNSTTIIIPNSAIIGKNLINWNYTRNFIAIDDILLTVHFKEDPEAVRLILLAALDSHAKILKNPAPVVRLDNVSDIGFVFMIRGFLSTNYTLDRWDIASEIRINAIHALRGKGMEIAIPVRLIIPPSQYPCETRPTKSAEKM